MLTDKTWTRALAMALVLPLAAACAESGEDEFEDTETLETTPTEMNRVELESFGTTDIEGWVTARTEGEEIVLTLNLDETRAGMATPAPGTEGEVGTEPRAEGEATNVTRHSARLVEGMCMDVRPGSQGLGETTPGETPTDQPEEGMGEDESVRTVAEFEEPRDRSGTSARPGMERSGETTGTSPMSAHTLEARLSQSEISGQASRSYAVVVEDDDSQDIGAGTEAQEGQDENRNVVACADVTRLIQNAGSPAGTTGQQPTGTEGTERGSEEPGSNY